MLQIDGHGYIFFRVEMFLPGKVRTNKKLGMEDLLHDIHLSGYNFIKAIYILKLSHSSVDSAVGLCSVGKTSCLVNV